MTGKQIKVMEGVMAVLLADGGRMVVYCPSVDDLRSDVSVAIRILCGWGVPCRLIDGDCAVIVQAFGSDGRGRGCMDFIVREG